MPSNSTLGGPRMRVGSTDGDNDLFRGGSSHHQINKVGDVDQRNQLVSLHEALCHSVEQVVGQIYHGPIGGRIGTSSPTNAGNTPTTTDVVFKLAKALSAASNSNSTITTNNGIHTGGAVPPNAGMESALKGIVDPAVLLFDQYSVRLEAWVASHFNAAIEATDVDINCTGPTHTAATAATTPSANTSSFFGTGEGVPPSPIQHFKNDISPPPSPQQQPHTLPHLNASWTMTNATMDQMRESSMMLGGSGVEKKVPQLTDVGNTLEIMLKLEGAPPTSSFTKRPPNATISSRFEAGAHHRLGQLPPHLAGTASAIFQADGSALIPAGANSHSRPNSRIQGGNVSPNRRPNAAAAADAHRLSTPGINNDTSSVASKGILGHSATTTAASFVKHPGVPAHRPVVLLVAAFDVTSLLQHPFDSKASVELRLACQVRQVCDSISSIHSRGAHVVLGIAPYSDLVSTPSTNTGSSSSPSVTHPETFAKVSELVKQALLLTCSTRSSVLQRRQPNQYYDISSPLPPTIEATCPSISSFASIEDLTGQSIPTLLDLNVFGIHVGNGAASSLLSDPNLMSLSSPSPPNSRSPTSSSSTLFENATNITSASILHAAALASENAKAARRMAMLRNKKAISGLINAGAVDVSSILGDRRASMNTTGTASNNISFAAATATAAAAATAGANAPTTTPAQNSLTAITSNGTRPRLCILNLGTICTTILQTVQSIHQDYLGDDNDGNEEDRGSSITSSSMGVGGGSMNSLKLANIQKTAVSRVFGSLLGSVSCVVLEDSFGSLWEHSRRWLVPSLQPSSTPSFPSYMSPLQDLLIALERSTRSKVLSILGSPVSPSLPTHHPTRKVFESLTSPFVALPSSGTVSSIGGDVFPSPHRTHVLSSSLSYRLSGPYSSSSSDSPSTSQHLPFLFYSSPASTQESVRALLCSLVNGCTTDLLQSSPSPTKPPGGSTLPTTTPGASAPTTVTATRRRRVKMLILGDGDGDQCLTLCEWEAHMRRVSEIVANTFGPARRRKSNTTTLSDAPNVHHAPPVNSSEAPSTPYYPTTLELLVASVEEVVESAFAGFIQIEQELREQTEAANWAANEALGDIQNVEEIQGDSSSSSDNNDGDLLSISGGDGGELQTPRSRAAQLGLTKDALVRHFLGILVRSMAEEIFIGGKAAPVLRILADQREAMEELGFGAVDGGSRSMTGSGSTRRPQHHQSASTTTQPPPVLPAFVPASLIRACQMLLDVVSSVRAVNDEEEVEADDATATVAFTEEGGGKQLGSSIAIPNVSGGTVSSSVNVQRTTSTSTTTKAVPAEDSNATLEALFRSCVLGNGGGAPTQSSISNSRGATLNNQPTPQSIFTNCAPGSLSTVSISRPRNRVTSVSINVGGGGRGKGLPTFEDDGGSSGSGGDGEQVSMASSMFSSFMSNSTAGVNRTGVDVDPPFAFLKKKPLASASSADRWALLPPPANNTSSSPPNGNAPTLSSSSTGYQYGTNTNTNSRHMEDHLRRAFASQPVALLLPADIIVSRVTTSRKVRSDTFGLTDVSRLAVPSSRRGRREDDADDSPNGSAGNGVVCDAPSTAVLSFKDRVKLLLMYEYDFSASKQGDPSTNRHIKTEQHTVFGTLSNAHRRRYTDIGPLSVGALHKRFVYAVSATPTPPIGSGGGPTTSSSRAVIPASTSVIWVGNLGSSLIQMRSQMDDGAVMPFAIRKLIADGDACFGDEALRRGIQRTASSHASSQTMPLSSSIGAQGPTKAPSPFPSQGVGATSSGSGGGVLVPGPPKPLVPLPTALVEGLISSSSIPEQALHQLLMGDTTVTPSVSNNLLSICASGAGITVAAAAPTHHSTNTSANATTNNNNTTASVVKQPWLETSKHGTSPNNNTNSHNVSTISENGLAASGGESGGGADDSVDLYQQSIEFFRLLRTSSTLCLLNAICGVNREANFTAVSSGQIQVWSTLLPTSLSTSSRRPQNVSMQVIPAQLFFKNLAQPFVTPRYEDAGDNGLSFHSTDPLLDVMTNGMSPPPSSLSLNRPANKGSCNERVSVAASHVEIVMALSNLLL